MCHETLSRISIWRNPRLGRIGRGHYIVEGLEEIAIHSANHYCKERAVLRADGTNDVFAEVLAAIGHGGLTAGLHSAVTGARIAFKARLVSKPQSHTGVGGQSRTLP